MPPGDITVLEQWLVFRVKSSTSLPRSVGRTCGDVFCLFVFFLPWQCAMLSPTFKVREFKVEEASPYAVQLKWKQSMADEEA